MTTSQTHLPANFRAGAAGQRGVVLLLALIVLVAMTLAGIGMMRSVDTGNLIAGNFAFKQSALQAGNQGVDAAAAAILTLSTNGLTGANSAGYFAYSTWNNDACFTDATVLVMPGCSGVDPWANAVTLAQDAAGNTVSYVTERMCVFDAALGEDVCGRTAPVYSIPGGSGPPIPASAIYYRVTVRTFGPRNTVSYAQAFIF